MSNNASIDAEDMNDIIFKDSDGGSTTFDESAEWDKKGGDDEDKSVMNGSTKIYWTIIKRTRVTSIN